ncbi:CidA/LrgA family protein [Eoetvoesiella caeni]|uniref:Putative effector of murein hydrolase LrgA (UPF0299 family) n=1 Tax=Eoetvoesiella caeni TaxID=645616 RepID=A0A366HMD9_9BURK|nr:CidA/LrgA family protein [Eoetvoesiella caeni]MCI2807467.1 CidA/LrgA family protein [Eoetvoesiella caeni]NYT53138.1 CidA/LrgA family protein [Eoetvoesiella caeni]RBP43115.1 putative effector of murein hydrolase LrgA (UPF0299 family) [Eoetvoesiella caeni]
MPVLFAVTTLLFMQFLGEAFVRLTGLPVPGALVGLLLLFAVLCLNRGAPKSLRDTTSHILQHLMLLFIPVVAGIMLHFERIANEWVPFLAASLGGTVITILVTAITFRWMLQRAEASKPPEAKRSAS